MKMSEELKPCPFCGNPKPRIVYNRYARELYVVCDGINGCHAHSGRISYSYDNITAEHLKIDKEYVAKLWNRRTDNDKRR